MLKRTIASLAIGTTALVGSLSGVASASPSGAPNAGPTGYGFDGNAHLIVGAGSTTVYKLAQSLASLWDSTSSCSTNNAAAPQGATGATTSYPPPAAAGQAALNQCVPATQTYNGVFAGGNYDGDTVAIAAAAGSSSGLASLNGDKGTNASTYAYEGGNANLPTTDTSPLSGYTNGYGTPDFVLSSRAAKLTGGNCPLTGPTGATNDELACDTFWGVAADGVEIISWGSRAGLTPGTGGSVANELTAADIYKIYSCQITDWSQIPNLNLAAGPIVPWQMNSGSGTYADFINYEIAQGGAPSNFTPNSYACDRPLSTGGQPLENDIKPLVNDAATASPSSGQYSSVTPGLSNSLSSVNDPSNWFWFGSFGLLSAFPYLANYTYSGTGDGNGGNGYAVTTSPAPVNGMTPSTGNIFSGKYAIPRILNLVTPKADADCPLNSNNQCDLTAGTPPTNGNGVTDINVLGAKSGPAGAVREFIRFICRKTASQEPNDPYTGANELTEISQSLAASGFAAVPIASRSAGSSCDVQSYG